MSKGNVFLISDTHFNHGNILTFKDENGNPLRVFNDVIEMNEVMVERWNARVQPKDKVYHLGDIAIGKKGLSLLERCNGTKVLIKGNHDCLCEKTQCLTQRGWLFYHELNITDKVLSINNGHSSWQQIDEIFIQDRKEDLIEVKSSRISMLMTKKHRVLASLKKKTNYQYLLAEDLYKHKIFSFPVAAPSSNSDFPISDLELELLAWIYTDSSFGSSHNGIYLYQSKVDSILNIEKCLSALNIPFTKKAKKIKLKGSLVAGKTLKKDSLVPFVFYIPAAFGLKYLNMIGKDKTTLHPFLNKLSDKQVLFFIEKIIEANGTYCTHGKKNSAAIHGEEKFLDSLQSLCISHGISASISSFRNNFVLNVCFTKQTKTCNQYKVKCISKVPYSGKVWCIKTLYSNFMVRRNGFSYFTGNCEKLSVYEQYFKDVRASHVFESFLLSHIPIHPSSLERFACNIHGHLHSRKVLLEDRNIDPHYLNICVEHTGYMPLAIEEIRALILKQGGTLEMKSGKEKYEEK